MASIIKRGDRDGYVVRWREGGQQRSRRCPDRKTAEVLKRDVERATATGERWEAASDRRLDDVDDVAAEYARSCVRRLAPRTAKTYADHLDQFVAWLKTTDPRRRRWTIDVLSKQVLEAYFDWLGEPTGRHGRPRIVSTRRKYVASVEVFWNWAWKHDDRFVGVPRPRLLLEELPVDPPPVTQAPTWAEMDACIAAATGWQRQLALVLRFTGLRVDQAMRLRWDDVDLDRRELTVRPELGKSRQERRGRVVPLSQHLVDQIVGWGVREGWLVPCGREAGPRAREARTRDMNRAWRRAGVREAVWRGHGHHAFRKGFESGLLGLGAPFPHVEYLVGHSIRGSADPYVDARIAYDLRATVDLVPELAEAARVFPRRSPGGEPKQRTRA